MRAVGLHMRLTSTMRDLANQALALQLPIFQCFCIMQATNKLLIPTAEEIADFLAVRSHFDQLYLHGSYWINLARETSTVLKIVNREVSFAKKHAFTHMIIHPGSAVRGTKKVDAIDCVARLLNAICKEVSDIQFVLENTTHANTSVGSNIEDFALLREKIEYPDRIGFCIDTAHAYEYGYSLNTSNGFAQFMTLLEQCIGFENIMLLHINDTKQQRGSRIDHHAAIGQGEIGTNWLKQFATYDALKKIPIILELPSSLELEQQGEMIDLVRGW